jgi:hypothetical protein
MITVLISAEDGVEALAVTLNALVPGVVDGLVGDAVVLTRRADEGLARIADTVGATLVATGGDAFRDGARHAKREWILCLAAGDVPTDGWIRALDRFITLSPPDRRFGRLARQGGSWRERLAALRFARTVRSGDLVRRSVLLDTARLPRPVRVSASIERDPVFG